MTITSAELSSMTATVEDLVKRLEPIAARYGDAHREDLVAEIHEVERALNGALRRLSRLTSAPGA